MSRQIPALSDIAYITQIKYGIIRRLAKGRTGQALKIVKLDLYGIWYVASQLGKFSDHALDEFHTLSKQHPKRFKTFQKNTQTWFDNTMPNNWLKLEAQDPSGKLRKLNFERIMKKLVE